MWRFGCGGRIGGHRLVSLGWADESRCNARDTAQAADESSWPERGLPFYSRALGIPGPCPSKTRGMAGPCLLESPLYSRDGIWGCNEHSPTPDGGLPARPSQRQQRCCPISAFGGKLLAPSICFIPDFHGTRSVAWSGPSSCGEPARQLEFTTRRMTRACCCIQ